MHAYLSSPKAIGWKMKKAGQKPASQLVFTHLGIDEFTLEFSFSLQRIFAVLLKFSLKILQIFLRFTDSAGAFEILHGKKQKHSAQNRHNNPHDGGVEGFLDIDP